MKEKWQNEKICQIPNAVFKEINFARGKFIFVKTINNTFNLSLS